METRRRKAGHILRAAAAIACALALAACSGTIDTERPVGIGSTPNTLKSSPCACIELPNAARG